jgi:phenylalanine-4-hydroxylase
MTEALIAPALRAPPQPWRTGRELARLPYRAEDGVAWRSLHARQTKLLEQWACSDFMKGMWVLGIHSDVFPDLARLGERLYAATSWKLVALHEPIDQLTFFGHLAQRSFPLRSTIVGNDSTRAHVGADLFHHLFGHVPMLMQPLFAEYLQMLGQAVCDAGPGALPLFWQHYERTADRGLIRTPRGMRMYGATLLCEATGELARPAARPISGTTVLSGPVSGFMAHGGECIALDDCCVIDSFEQLIAMLPRTGATMPIAHEAARGRPRLGFR